MIVIQRKEALEQKDYFPVQNTALQHFIAA